MINQSGWTGKALLNEAEALENQLRQTNDPNTQRQLNGCLKAVQETLLERKRKGVTDE